MYLVGVFCQKLSYNKIPHHPTMSEPQIPAWMSQEAIDTLSRGYLFQGETPRGMYNRVAKAVAKYLSYPEIEGDIFEILWRGYLGLATPVASNFGTNRGLPVSCYSNHISDNVPSIYSHLKENAALSQHGGGVGTYFGDIRPAGAPISSGGKSTGAVPWMRQYDQCASVVNQGGVRRGSFALYLPIDHPDVPELLRAKDHTQGDPRTFIDSNIGLTVSDEWVQGLLNGDKEKVELFEEVIKCRLRSGSPYLIFIDNANRQNPACYKQRGLEVSLSNLCTEIFLHTDENHTFVCVLSSMNLLKYDEWKDWRGPNTGKSAPELAIYLLDAVVEEFIHKADRMNSMGRAVRFARKSRALGLGTMGLHAYYQSKDLPFKSEEARKLNIEMHKFIEEKAKKASMDLAVKFGEPEWCEGTGMRHTHLTAIAPTKSNSVISGAISQGVEPIDSNYYSADQSKGVFARKNKFLEAHLERLNQNTPEVWKSILENRGSVQHLEFLPKEVCEVFKTAREVDQFELIRQAKDRQPFVSQGQSINLFVDPEASAEYLSMLHLSAWKAGLKSLYYLKSSSPLKNKKAKKVAKIITKETCPYCVMAKSLLKSQGWEVDEIDRSKADYLWNTEWRTVPQIWLNEKHIGGYSDLESIVSKDQSISIEPPSSSEPSYNECVACEG
jgi:ribonucleoside-diphosphate reductase alpha chain